MGFGLQPRLARATFRLNCLAARWLPASDAGLLVVTYHRVGTRDQVWPEAVPLAEATPDQFSAQMDWIRTYCQPVELEEARRILRGELPCPRRAVLVTFDDGYREDLQRALPALQRNHIRATVFLPTAYVGERRRFWWDRLAVCLQITTQRRLVGTFFGCPVNELLDGPAARDAAMSLLAAPARRYAPDERQAELEKLERVLEVGDTRVLPRPLVVSWDEARALRDRFDFAAHTHTHCRCAGLDAQALRAELGECKAIIDRELGGSCYALAIPYGTLNDFTDENVRVAGEVGLDLVFSMADTMGSPRRIGDALLVDRVTLDANDGLAGLAAKLTFPKVYIPDWTGRAGAQLKALLAG